ncbi:MAG: hypothetical protein INQ03_09925 [Candidatus Heimdallarchaeota archaeon]|nr:hypothetical protein [Candidatus Heimdallarchaeota archaeon]
MRRTIVFLIAIIIFLILWNSLTVVPDNFDDGVASVDSFEVQSSSEDKLIILDSSGVIGPRVDEDIVITIVCTYIDWTTLLTRPQSCGEDTLIIPARGYITFDVAWSTDGGWVKTYELTSNTLFSVAVVPPSALARFEQDYDIVQGNYVEPETDFVVNFISWGLFIAVFVIRIEIWFRTKTPLDRLDFIKKNGGTNLTCSCGQRYEAHLSSCSQCSTKTPSCALCYASFEKGEQVFHLPCCDSYLHSEDLFTWLKKNHRICPLCRRELLSLSGSYLYA